MEKKKIYAPKREVAATILKNIAANIMELTEAEAAGLSGIVLNYIATAAAMKGESTTEAVTKAKPRKRGRPKQGKAVFADLITPEAPTALQEATAKVLCKEWTKKPSALAATAAALMEMDYIKPQCGSKDLYTALLHLIPQRRRREYGTYATFAAYIKPPENKPYSIPKKKAYNTQFFIDTITEAL